MESIKDIIESSLKFKPGKVYPTGFEKLDAYLSGGLHNGVSLVSGRPAIGKTGFALGICHNLINNKMPAAYLGLNEPYQNLVKRFLCLRGLIEMDSLNQNLQYSESIANSMSEIDVMPFFFNDCSSYNIGDIINESIKLHRKRYVDVFIIDSLPQLYFNTQRSDKKLRPSIILHELKYAAEKYKLSYVVINGIKRQVEYRKNFRPALSDILGDDFIEEMADVVLLIFREKYYDPYASSHSEIILSKNKFGRTGTIDLDWDENKLCF